jgi:hypothetical protein
VNQKPIPIFIVGKHRSGTTWLSNLLINHTDIAAIKSQKHGGIHESAFFSNVKYYFKDIDDINNYITFLEAFSQSDYFILSDLKKQDFYRKKTIDNINDFNDFFKVFMERFAIKENKNYWLEKSPTHTIFINDIYKNFKNAKFVAIKRDLKEVIMSTIKIFGKDKPKKWYLIKQIYHYIGYNKIIKEFENNNNSSIFLVKYSDLKAKNEVIMEQLCDFLDIDFEKNIISSNFKNNSSYSSESEKDSILTSIDIMIIFIFGLVFQFIPCWFYKFIYKSQYKYLKVSLPDWFFKNKKEKINN